MFQEPSSSGGGLKKPRAQWTKLQKEKYASTQQRSDLIRMSRHIKGSYISDKAWENRSLVQNNSFQEIRAGDLALFWEDKQKQEPTLIREEFISVKQETGSQGLIKVKGFWNLSHDYRKWTNQRNIDCKEDSPIKSRGTQKHVKTKEDLGNRGVVLVKMGPQ